MGNGDDRLPLGQYADRLLNDLLALRVERGSRFVEQQYGRIPQNARAMETRCFCPPERLPPASPTTLS